jgi:hypothetical protein
MGSPESDPDSIHTRFLGGTKKLDARRKKKANTLFSCLFEKEIIRSPCVFEKAIRRPKLHGSISQTNRLSVSDLLIAFSFARSVYTTALLARCRSCSCCPFALHFYTCKHICIPPAAFQRMVGLARGCCSDTVPFVTSCTYLFTESCPTHVQRVLPSFESTLDFYQKRTSYP